MRLSLKTVQAHCDIPCGLYESSSMEFAADTCARMIEKIEALGELDTIEKHNTFVRAVMVKEEHAERVKEELYELWGDYFKPVHLEKYPDLHSTIWAAVKQASTVKQTVSAEEAQKLKDMVHTVAELFADSKK